jgi:hypothetical protein
MLASLDCVTRQECWEPFLPKASSTVCSITTRKILHQSIDVWTENWDFQSTNEQKPSEKWQMTWKRHLPSSTTCCHMINKEKLVSSHHSSPQTWQSLPPKILQMCWWWSFDAHVYIIPSVFLTVKKSAWVSPF